MKLSIVTTLYQSAQYLERFYQRATAVAQQFAPDDYEIIFVHDGSPDNSLPIAIDLSEKDTHIVVIDLSRNFGHHKAMMTGLQQAQGDQIFLLDSDLEEEPEWLLPFAKQMQSESLDVVYGQQTSRKGNSFERWSGQWFYPLFKRLTGLSLPTNMVTARLMTRRYVDNLLRHQEREIFMAGLWHITGFDQGGHSVRKHHSSSSTYTFKRKMSLLVNSVTSFSNAPLVSIFYFGLSISLLAGGCTLYLLTQWLFFTKPLSGWTSMMASIWLLGGMIISFIGIVGIYLSKIFTEIKQRPYTIIRHRYDSRKDNPSH